MTLKDIKRLQQLAADLPPEAAGTVLTAATQELEQLVEKQQLVITAARLGLADVHRMALGGDTYVDAGAILQRYIVGLSRLEGRTAREFVSARTARPGVDPVFDDLMLVAWAIA